MAPLRESTLHEFWKFRVFVEYTVLVWCRALIWVGTVHFIPQDSFHFFLEGRLIKSRFIDEQHTDRTFFATQRWRRQALESSSTGSCYCVINVQMKQQITTVDGPFGVTFSASTISSFIFMSSTFWGAKHKGHILFPKYSKFTILCENDWVTKGKDVRRVNKPVGYLISMVENVPVVCSR